MGKPAKIKRNKKNIQYIIDLYASDKTRKQVQEEIAEKFGVCERQVRRVAKELGINQIQSRVSNDKVLIYDIETSRVRAYVWSTGKQYINHKQLRSQTTIISIA
jgi:hypothetical protein